MKTNRTHVFLTISAMVYSLMNSTHAINYQWDVNGSATGLGVAGTWNATNAFWDNTLISNLDNADQWSGGLFTYNSQALQDDSTFTLGSNEWLFDYNDLTGGSNFSADQAGATRYVTMTAIPETSTSLLGVISMLAFLRRHRSHRSQVSSSDANA